MRVVRNRRKYYIRITLRIMLCVICIVAGTVAGIIYMDFRNDKKMQQKRLCFYVLNRDVEAGELLNEASVEMVPVINERDRKVENWTGGFVGKRVKQPLKKGCVLSECLLCGENDKGQGIRKVPYSFVRNMDALKKGNYIDVRISFPNGADFTVLGKKEVLGVETDERSGAKNLWLGLGEEEILRMSSAVVDAYLFEGAYIYAVLYLDALQDETIVNYPVNEVVEELMKKNPNIIEIAKKQMTLEMRSSIYKNAPNQKEECIQQEEGKQKETLDYFH